MLWDQFIIDKVSEGARIRKASSTFSKTFFCFSSTYASQNPLLALSVSILPCYVFLQRTCDLFLILFIQRSFGLKTKDSAVHFLPTLCLTKQ